MKKCAQKPTCRETCERHKEGITSTGVNCDLWAQEKTSQIRCCHTVRVLNSNGVKYITQQVLNPRRPFEGINKKL